MTLVERAKQLAFRAHAGQVDKAGRPYIEHVARVAAAVADDPEAETVAWLHDVLEDCGWDEGLDAFPQSVLLNVMRLTRHSDANAYYADIRCNPIALRVKLADLADNADESRLALLDEVTADRLRRKYANAMQQLRPNARLSGCERPRRPTQSARRSRPLAVALEPTVMRLVPRERTTMDNEPKLTEEEQTEVGRAMLTAALEALGEFPDNTGGEDQYETARRVVRALAAAATVAKAEEKRLCEAKGTRCFVFVETDAHEAAATAFWMWSERVELDVSEVHARSVVGDRYLGFAQGLAAAWAMTEALNMLGDCLAFSFINPGALHLRDCTLAPGNGLV